jgi:hypothetical protein
MKCVNYAKFSIMTALYIFDWMTYDTHEYSYYVFFKLKKQENGGGKHKQWKVAVEKMRTKLDC